MQIRPYDQGEVDELRAAMAVNRQLLLALYDATLNKDLVISQFAEVSEGTSVHTLFSEMSDEFYNEFERQRAGILQLLIDARV